MSLVEKRNLIYIDRNDSVFLSVIDHFNVIINQTDLINFDDEEEVSNILFSSPRK